MLDVSVTVAPHALLNEVQSRQRRFVGLDTAVVAPATVVVVAVATVVVLQVEH